MDKLIKRIGELGIIPIATISDARNAINLAQALLNAELDCIEFTFRTEAAADAIRRVAENIPDMLIGAGTVITIAQAESAVKAGARFIVTPGFDHEIVGWCQQRGVIIIPGVATPTEINLAFKQGLGLLKHFPSEAMGGLKMLKAIAGPYRQMLFIPTGGITESNLRDYLSLSNVFACGGSWLVDKTLIRDQNFQEVTQRAKSALEIVRSVRGLGETS